MDYTQQAVLKVRARVQEWIGRFIADRNVRLDPGSPIWFDGNMALPTPGEPWKLTLSSHGKLASVEFTPNELDDFMARSSSEVVSKRLATALDSLQPKR